MTPLELAQAIVVERLSRPPVDRDLFDWYVKRVVASDSDTFAVGDWVFAEQSAQRTHP